MATDMWGKEQQTSGTTVINQTSTPKPTAEETALNQLQLKQAQATAPAQTQAQLSGLSLINQLLTGSNQLPGFLSSLSKGISEEDTQRMVNQSLRDLYPQFQAQGLMDSGTMISAGARTAGDIRNQNAQFNVGAMQNMLNLALSGQAQVQSPILGQASILSSRLAGLRPVNTAGTTNASQINPFLTGQSMMQGIGTGLAVGATLCWVAKEIFGSWEHPKTIKARYYISNYAPIWFRKFYLENGENIAKFIHNKPILRMALRPLFEVFAVLGERKARLICL